MFRAFITFAFLYITVSVLPLPYNFVEFEHKNPLKFIDYANRNILFKSAEDGKILRINESGKTKSFASISNVNLKYNTAPTEGGDFLIYDSKNNIIKSFSANGVKDYKITPTKKGQKTYFKKVGLSALAQIIENKNCNLSSVTFYTAAHNPIVWETDKNIQFMGCSASDNGHYFMILFRSKTKNYAHIIRHIGRNYNRYKSDTIEIKREIISPLFITENGNSFYLKVKNEIDIIGGDHSIKRIDYYQDKYVSIFEALKFKSLKKGPSFFKEHSSCKNSIINNQTSKNNQELFKFYCFKHDEYLENVVCFGHELRPEFCKGECRHQIKPIFIRQENNSYHVYYQDKWLALNDYYKEVLLSKLDGFKLNTNYKLSEVHADKVTGNLALVFSSDQKKAVLFVKFNINQLETPKENTTFHFSHLSDDLQSIAGSITCANKQTACYWKSGKLNILNFKHLKVNDSIVSSELVALYDDFGIGNIKLKDNTFRPFLYFPNTDDKLKIQLLENEMDSRVYCIVNNMLLGVAIDEKTPKVCKWDFEYVSQNFNIDGPDFIDFKKITVTPSFTQMSRSKMLSMMSCVRDETISPELNEHSMIYCWSGNLFGGQMDQKPAIWFPKKKSCKAITLKAYEEILENNNNSRDIKQEDNISCGVYWISKNGKIACGSSESGKAQIWKCSEKGQWIAQDLSILLNSIENQLLPSWMITAVHSIDMKNKKILLSGCDSLKKPITVVCNYKHRI